MNSVAVKEAKNGFTHLLHLVENGEPVQISRHGKAVAILASVSSFNEANQNTAFAESLIAWRAKSASVLSNSEFSNSEIEKIFNAERKVENLSRAEEISKISELWSEGKKK
ncbi:type II toxin-antitoxin system Phd/YefM family antitoxin [uncultured Treponema sp.]|uniref:type II toxin-antitoxin system Phd/YefM family antitoxin n=1 Tax=uncultured Treponema sp. TaxID=162155 RepID=UPI0025E34049|nr:type II toxin-antitoxin system prevent-host-death family antitoxin [uncultured Treponema sp.]